MKKAIIIGSGIGGLSTAVRLRARGFDVDVFEKNSFPGGKLSNIDVGKYRFNTGPSLFTMPHFVDELYELFNENPRDHFNYIKKDIIVFGIGVFIFIVLTLWFIFRNIKWVVMPLLGCATSVILMIGLLGLIGWKVTVISSNFIALMLILNMAMNIM